MFKHFRYTVVASLILIVSNSYTMEPAEDHPTTLFNHFKQQVINLFGTSESFDEHHDKNLLRMLDNFVQLVKRDLHSGSNNSLAEKLPNRCYSLISPLGKIINRCKAQVPNVFFCNITIITDVARRIEPQNTEAFEKTITQIQQGILDSLKGTPVKGLTEEQKKKKVIDRYLEVFLAEPEKPSSEKPEEPKEDLSKDKNIEKSDHVDSKDKEDIKDKNKKDNVPSSQESFISLPKILGVIGIVGGAAFIYNKYANTVQRKRDITAQ
jgi:hypothetical protein